MMTSFPAQCWCSVLNIELAVLHCWLRSRWRLSCVARTLRRYSQGMNKIEMSTKCTNQMPLLGKKPPWRKDTADNPEASQSLERKLTNTEPLHV